MCCRTRLPPRLSSTASRAPPGRARARVPKQARPSRPKPARICVSSARAAHACLTARVRRPPEAREAAEPLRRGSDRSVSRAGGFATAWRSRRRCAHARGPPYAARAARSSLCSSQRASVWPGPGSLGLRAPRGAPAACARPRPTGVSAAQRAATLRRAASACLRRGGPAPLHSLCSSRRPRAPCRLHRSPPPPRGLRRCCALARAPCPSAPPAAPSGAT